VRITGPVSFTLLAVWTWPDPTYLAAIDCAMEAYASLFDAGPVVMAGDFNSSAHSTKSVRGLSHATIDHSLARHKLQSAYHAVTGEVSGQETRGTYYTRNVRDASFHIDYCYIPSAWVSSVTNVAVGDYEQWRALSDHRPLTIDMDLTMLSGASPQLDGLAPS
jgi:endonuclease/exonuclease/phosphatase family metal-dependent hydrolase